MPPPVYSFQSPKVSVWFWNVVTSVQGAKHAAITHNHEHQAILLRIRSACHALRLLARGACLLESSSRRDGRVLFQPRRDARVRAARGFPASAPPATAGTPTPAPRSQEPRR